MSGAGEPTRGMNGREVYGSLSGGDASDTDSELGDVLHSDDSGLLSDSGSGDGKFTAVASKSVSSSYLLLLRQTLANRSSLICSWIHSLRLECCR